MTHLDLLRQSFAGVEVNADFTEAVVTLHDGGRLCFRHQVGERHIEASREETKDSVADRLLAGIALFRLNAKHLDIQFTDGSRWEARFR